MASSFGPHENIPVEIGSGTILLVDDDAVNRQLLSMLFRDAGFATLEAGTGEAALRMAGQRPDVIVLDVNLPDVSGFEVCRQIKSDPRLKSAAIIHLSAVFVNSENRSQGLEGGADAYLIKPVDHRELKATVRALLRIREAEELARQAANEWQTTFDAISDGVCVVAPGGEVKRCNRALSEMLNLGSPYSVVGRHLGEALKAGLKLDGPELELLLATAAEGRRRSAEAATAGALPRAFRYTVGPILDAEGRTTGSVVTLTDITQQRQLEEQVRKGEQLEAIGRLAAGIAHEFNNLLTSIVGNTSILLRAAPPRSHESQLLESINSSAWRAAHLTNQLLGFARKALLWLRAVRPEEVLAEVAREADLPPAVRLEVGQGPGLWVIQADPSYLVQLLRRLCLFGAERMPNGGKLLLEAENVELSMADVAG
jgi:CheY-like chemotaxis protein